MKNTHRKKDRMFRAGRGASLVVSLICVLGLLAGSAVTSQAYTWMDPYLDTVTEWGVMKGDSLGNLYPERQITRAEFVAMINRAFGYTETGKTPFKDVPEDAWYAEDIAIAYKAGYFTGTSKNEASPEAPVTREQNVTLIGRNLRLKEGAGLATEFTDNKDMGAWSRGIIEEATNLGIVSGYEDGSFRPLNPITRGEAAAIIARAMGTLISEKGDKYAGGVYGNLTINTPGVNLRNTVVTGDLYLTGGLGLEDSLLENVDAMGRIVACGTGNSQKGDSSIMMRNVTAKDLNVDSMADQFMSIRTEGRTVIDSATVHTSAYIEDDTNDKYGIKLMTFDGANGAKFQVAGNIKEAINVTPNSTLEIADGTAGTVTVDEKAVGSKVTVDADAWIDTLNLDTGVTVDGKGDIDQLNISADGAVVNILPDKLYIRPGVKAKVGGIEMDSKTAEEYSEDPKILAGYPEMKNVAPKSADAVFKTNKAGTLYWALTTYDNGSASKKQLTDPGSYTSTIVKSGNIKVAASDTEVIAKLSGLNSDSRYYISAILMDSRGKYSSVKSKSFRTPDDSVPAFASGYPVAILTDEYVTEGGIRKATPIIQANVMTTKSCRLYYALLPKGSTPPTESEFKNNNVKGNLGSGHYDMIKNTPKLFPEVNDQRLEEQTAYDLYLWLTDVDNGKSSAVKKLTVTTPDKTPPVIEHLAELDMAAKTITMNFSMNEPGNLYWAVVKSGMPFFRNGVTDPAIIVNNLPMGKIQIETGTGAIKKGNASAAKASTDVNFTISGLEEETAYDLYYVAKDKSGNYNMYTADLTPPMVVYTLDEKPPTVTQEFTHDGTDNPKSLAPYPDSSIRLVFSENVQGIRYEGSTKIESQFLELYDEVKNSTGAAFTAAQDKLASALKAHIKLYNKAADGQTIEVKDRNSSNESPDGTDWVIDYRKAVVEKSNDGSGKMTIMFPYYPESGKSALNLSSGSTYYFTLEGICDRSPNLNKMVPTSRGVTVLPEFRTIDAQMIFSRVSTTESVDGKLLDMSFRLTPDKVENSDANTQYDLILWSDQHITFDLYYRENGGEWNTLLTNAVFNTTLENPEVGICVAEKNGKESIGFLKEALDREYGFRINKIDTDDKRENWSGNVSVNIVPVSGDQVSMKALHSIKMIPAEYQKLQQSENKLIELGVPSTYTVSCPFEDSSAPRFIKDSPTFDTNESGVDINIMLSRNNVSYYCIVTEEKSMLLTKLSDTKYAGWDDLPKDGRGLGSSTIGNVVEPLAEQITNVGYSHPEYIVLNGKYTGGMKPVSLNGLKADTKYVAYFVLQGESTDSFSKVFAFKFKTERIERPVLTASQDGTKIKVESNCDAIAKGLLMVSGTGPTILSKKMSDNWADPSTEDPANYKALTVLEAIATPLENGSVFDIYGHEDAKKALASELRSAKQNGTTYTKVIDPISLTKPSYSLTADCKDGMIAGQRYNFIVMGESTQGSAPAFAGTLGMFILNSAGPELLYASTEVTEGANGYNGFVTIYFNEPLYYLSNNKKILRVVDKEIVNADAADPDVISSSYIVTVSNSVRIKQKFTEDDKPCESLKFQLINLQQGATISFSSTICNDLGFKMAKKQTLEFKVSGTKAEFVVK